MQSERLLNGSRPVFRNPDKFQVLPWREYMRQRLPAPSDGMVVEDLDLVALQIGKLVGRHRDADGKFMLIEVKNVGSSMGYAQGRLFAMMHRLFRMGDPGHQHYIGFYLLQWDSQQNKPHSINYAPCTEDAFAQWMTGKITLPSLFDVAMDG